MWTKLFISVLLLVGSFLFLNTNFLSRLIFSQRHKEPISTTTSIFNTKVENNIFDLFSTKETNDCSDTSDISSIRYDISRLLGYESTNKTVNQYFKEQKAIKNDFAYITIIPSSHDLDPTVNATASAWCQSIRTIHTARSNFDIIALFSSPSINFHTGKYKCFDKLIFVDENVKTYMSTLRDPLDMDVVSKAWLFSLVQYKRIIYLKHNIAPIRSNIYNYFFKDYYLPNKKERIYSVAAPKKVYTQSSKLSPMSTNFMSLEPSVDTAAELLSIYGLGKWNTENGWMCYGAFDFDPVPQMESFENPNEPSIQYQLTQKKKVIQPWHQSSWTFESSWSDTGLIFYYHYLKHPDTSGIINELDFDHSLIEYVSQGLSCIPGYTLIKHEFIYLHFFCSVFYIYSLDGRAPVGKSSFFIHFVRYNGN